jgi:hypothetical protein
LIDLVYYFARDQYPTAKVVTSTLDNITAVWNKEAQLPVVTQELADTWIWGTGSDPVKVAKMRALHRLRTSCEQEKEPRCTFSDPAYLLLKAKKYTHASQSETQKSGAN